MRQLAGWQLLSRGASRAADPGHATCSILHNASQKGFLRSNDLLDTERALAAAVHPQVHPRGTCHLHPVQLPQQLWSL